MMKRVLLFVGLLLGSMVAAQNPPAPGPGQFPAPTPPPLVLAQPQADPAPDPAPVAPQIHGRGFVRDPNLEINAPRVNAAQPVDHRRRLAGRTANPAVYLYAYLTPVEDQGQEGTCWDFASVALLESLWKKATGLDVAMSTQRVLDCIHNGWNCRFGGNFAGDFLRDKGTVSAASVPYQGCAQSCSDTTGTYKFDSWGYVSNTGTATTDEIKTALINYGPVAVGVAAEMWDSYRGGDAVLRGTGMIDHLVLIVGYDNSKNAFRIKNSWGTSWGDKGYCWVAYGIGDSAAYAVLAAPPTPPVPPGPTPPPDPTPVPPPGPTPAPAMPGITFVTPFYINGKGYFDVDPSLSAQMIILPAKQPSVTAPSIAVTPVYDPAGVYGFVQIMPQTKRLRVEIPANQPASEPAPATAPPLPQPVIPPIQPPANIKPMSGADWQELFGKQAQGASVSPSPDPALVEQVLRLHAQHRMTDGDLKATLGNLYHKAG